MKWIAAIQQRRPSLRTGRTMFFLVLAAIVLSMPLGFADTGIAAQSDAHSEAMVSAMELRFKQVGQAFGDFAFGVKSFLTFDESAKIELIKERNAEMRERQEAWLSMKEEAFDGELTLEERQEVEAMIQAEHEAIIKEHLRLTSELRDLQLKAKARGLASVESSAESAIESGSGLSLGLVSLDVNGDVNGKTRTRALFIEKTANANVHVSGNVALDSNTRAAINQLVANFSAGQDVKIEVEAEKEAGANATVESEVSGLAENQQALVAALEAKAKALVEASARADARVDIEIRHKAAVENNIDTAAEAQAVVEKRLRVDASNVTVETQDGVQVFVVTGTQTQTNGNFEMTKSFEVVVESGTGLILSADMTAHFEQVAGADASASAGVSGSTGTSAVISGSAGTSGSTSTGSSAGAYASASAGVSAGSGSASISSEVAADGGVSIG